MQLSTGVENNVTLYTVIYALSFTDAAFPITVHTSYISCYIYLPFHSTCIPPVMHAPL